MARAREEEAARLCRHQAWLEREKQAQLEWKARKLKEEQQRQACEQQEKQIQEEWNAMKKAEEDEKRKQEEEDRQRKQKQEALLRDALSELEQSATQNPPVPSAEERTVDSRPSLPLCPFFEKTGCCRFGPRCSRNHRHVLLGRCLLLEHFYQPLGVRYTLDDEQNLDVNLEFDDTERARHFANFYDDVLPELRSCGEVVQFKVCQNYEPHLRGNVYVQYGTENEAARAFRSLNGRWYGGEQISVRFVDIQRWSRAICGSFFRGNCPKGRNCNFLRVFVNPNGEFWRADRDLPSIVDSSRERSSRREVGGWSTERRSSRRSRHSEDREPRSSRRHSEDREPRSSRRHSREGERRSRRDADYRERNGSRRTSGVLRRDSGEHEPNRTGKRDESRHKRKSRRDDRASREKVVSERASGEAARTRRSRSRDSGHRSENRERRARHRTPDSSGRSKRHRSHSKERKSRDQKHRFSRTADRPNCTERGCHSTSRHRSEEGNIHRDPCEEKTTADNTSQGRHSSPKIGTSCNSIGASKCDLQSDSLKHFD